MKILDNSFGKKRHLCTSIIGLLKTGMVLSLIFLCNMLYGQTFPSPSSCSSKDLELVGATLPGDNICNSCTPGSVVTRTLYIAIYNKTGSTRTSFAFWGRLEIYNDDGTLDSTRSEFLSACVGSIPKNAVTNFPTSVSISFNCGQSLKLTNLFLAWTDASPNSTCASLLNNTSTINPKCGTLPFIQINAGVNASTVITTATCTSNGAIEVSPFGGKSPYSVTLGAVTNTNVSTSTTFTNLQVGTYSITITDANGCVTTKSRTVSPSYSTPAVPVSGGNQSQCEQSPLQTLTATATTPATLKWYTAATGGSIVSSPTLNSTGSIIYYAEASLGTCVSATRTAVTLTINANPAAPVSGGNQVQCQQSPLQTLTASATAAGSTITWYTAATGGTLVSPPSLSSVGSVTYYAQALIGSCNSSTRTPVALTINQTPAAPVSGGNQTQCEQSPLQTLTASATGSNVTWYTAASAGSLVAIPSLNSVGSATYYAQSTLGACNSFTRTPVSLTINPTPAAPVSGGNQTQCEQSPLQTLTASATGSNVTWYTAASAGSLVANPSLNSVGSVTYYAQSTLGSCNSFTRTPVALTINSTPASPVSGGNQEQCRQSPIQTLTAAATGNSITWYNAASGGNTVANPILNSVGSITYFAQASIGSCNSFVRTGVTLTINDLPPLPAICVVEPSLCGPSTGSIAFISPTGQGIQYSVDNGTTWQSSAVFNNVAAGSVTGIKVKDNNGCKSSSVGCSESSCASRPAPGNSHSSDDETINQEDNSHPAEKKISKLQTDQTLGVVAYPNPFKDNVKFVVTAPVSGKCTLEIFNIVGQKIKTIYQGWLPAGETTIEAALMNEHSGYFIYQLKTDQGQLTGKLIRINP